MWWNYSLPAHCMAAILLSCGIHGNETAPIEVIDAMLADIASGHLTALHHRLLVAVWQSQGHAPGRALSGLRPQSSVQWRPPAAA
jgi:hypothetical protein